MKNFASVGKRLRLYKFAALLFYAVAAFIFCAGTANYYERGAPRTWARGPSGEMHAVPMSPADPDYQDILRQDFTGYFYFVFWSAGFASVGTLIYLAARKPPAKAVLHLARERKGLLTLPEISTTLDIDPSLAAAALAKLQKLRIASPRWQEFNRNIWEFPDYLELPLAQSLKMAETSGGRLSLKDLLAAGHSLDTATQTLSTLTDKGLAHQDPGAPSPTVVLAPAAQQA